MQIVADKMHLRVIDMVGMDELARVLGLHPVLHLQVGVEAEEIVNERERVVEFGVS